MIIKKIKLENYTVFEDHQMEFCPGINIFIGENGTGKTHLLKVLYSACQSASKKISFSQKLVATMLPDDYRIARLITRKPGNRRGLIMYHYLPLEHALEPVGPLENPKEQIIAAMDGQGWTGGCAVAFFYSFVPYRAEWRYSASAHRVALLDAGHVVQNLYLACEAIGCGTCAVAAIDQKAADSLCRLDGQEEFIVYAAPVGLSDPQKNTEGNRQMYAQTILESDAVKPLEK